jgi:[ribosomal protein S5]-alanine N-acetyltransferase
MKPKNVSFTLRHWSLDDLDNLVKFANNKKIAGNLTDAFPHPYTREDGIAFISSVNPDAALHPDGVSDPDRVRQQGRVFAIDVDGTACGTIGIFPQTDVHRKNAEIGYWLAEEYWGMGIISEATRQVIDYGFKTYDVNRIFARPFSTNLASQKVLLKAGMKLEARLEKAIIKDGVFVDELIFSVLKAEK